jgi:hypothetical protein
MLHRTLVMLRCILGYAALQPWLCCAAAMAMLHCIAALRLDHAALAALHLEATLLAQTMTIFTNAFAEGDSSPRAGIFQMS